ncbi:DUF5013 domain-containing protein [Echinicola soli]|uniref:DUF5013 domain-containing protein n=1 Tax=Echinicola soli TaxID=2591634 RepID=A0A514CJ64_9BACT|nr:DUF4998 domain-containing protein [Echinicola soli]QDH79873.1 DUF5013 domain-containing protein [Echinicola soli]
MKKIDISKLLLVISVVYLAFSCSQMDDYREFVPDGEKTYSGKVDSLQIIGGDHKVMIWGLLTSDPKIEQARISWNAGSESIVIPVTKTSGVDTLQHVIGELEENNYTFEVVTIDNEGNESVPVYATGTAYGERYSSALNNRPIEKADLTVWNQNTIVEFGQLDLATGPLYSEIEYVDNEGERHFLDVPLESTEVVLENYQVGTDFKLRTYYKPEPHSMDTFPTEAGSVAPKVTYMRNMQVPFSTSEKSGRWGNLEGWITNDNAKIHGGYGGWDERSSGIFNLESGWGAPGISNGKIYQTFEVPSGSFTFRIKDLLSGNLSEDDDVYLVVAYGEELPDVENLDEAIAYTQVVASSPIGELAVDFDIQEGSTQISVGYLSTQSDAGRYCNIRAFDFVQH